MANLPHIADALIDRRKIEGYLLNLSHPQGRGKALFFLRFGFRSDRWEQLKDALLAHATAHRAAALEPSSFGRKYAIEGRLHSPDGRSPVVRAIWFVANDTATPVFVTAFPGQEEGDP